MGDRIVNRSAPESLQVVNATRTVSGSARMAGGHATGRNRVSSHGTVSEGGVFGPINQIRRYAISIPSPAASSNVIARSLRNLVGRSAPPGVASPRKTWSPCSAPRRATSFTLTRHLCLVTLPTHVAQTHRLSPLRCRAEGQRAPPPNAHASRTRGPRARKTDPRHHR